METRYKFKKSFAFRKNLKILVTTIVAVKSCVAITLLRRTLQINFWWMRNNSWCRARGEKNPQRGVSLLNYLISKNARLRQSSKLNQPCRMTLDPQKWILPLWSSLGAQTTTLHVFALVFRLSQKLSAFESLPIIETLAGKLNLVKKY